MVREKRRFDYFVFDFGSKKRNFSSFSCRYFTTLVSNQHVAKKNCRIRKKESKFEKKGKSHSILPSIDLESGNLAF